MRFSVLASITMASMAMAMPAKRAAVSAPTGDNVRDGVYISCNKPGVFALTFDDGPYEYSWDLATSLNKQGINATFFINGMNWVDVQKESVETKDGTKTYMEVIKHYKDMGHEIASHTYQHKVLTGLSASEVEYQMNTQSDIIYKAAGVRPAVMRPPTGAYDDTSIKVLRELGYAVVNWDVDTRDWENHDFTQEKNAYMAMDKDTNSTLGHITLEHEVFNQTVDQLVPWAIKYVEKKNYKFVTISECLDVPAYQ